MQLAAEHVWKFNNGCLSINTKSQRKYRRTFNGQPIDLSDNLPCNVPSSLPRGCHLNNSVVHKRPEKHEKGFFIFLFFYFIYLFIFFKAKRDSRKSRLGVKMYLFLRKGVLLDSFKGRLGVILQTCPPKKLV